MLLYSTALGFIVGERKLHGHGLAAVTDNYYYEFRHTKILWAFYPDVREFLLYNIGTKVEIAHIAYFTRILCALY